MKFLERAKLREKGGSRRFKAFGIRERYHFCGGMDL